MLVLCSSALSELAIAQEAPTEEPAPEPKEKVATPSTTTAQQPAPRPKTQPKSTRNDGVFKPSEEISEDFAVSFPVDI